MDNWDKIKSFAIDFGIPVLILVILAVLMLTGTDREIKTLFAATVGWLIKSGVSKVHQ